MKFPTSVIKSNAINIVFINISLIIKKILLVHFYLNCIRLYIKLLRYIRLLLISKSLKSNRCLYHWFDMTFLFFYFYFFFFFEKDCEKIYFSYRLSISSVFFLIVFFFGNFQNAITNEYCLKSLANIKRVVMRSFK